MKVFSLAWMMTWWRLLAVKAWMIYFYSNRLALSWVIDSTLGFFCISSLSFYLLI
jgi:hypothetical protein